MFWFLDISKNTLLTKSTDKQTTKPFAITAKTKRTKLKHKKTAKSDFFQAGTQRSGDVL